MQYITKHEGQGQGIDWKNQWIITITKTTATLFVRMCLRVAKGEKGRKNLDESDYQVQASVNPDTNRKLNCG